MTAVQLAALPGVAAVGLWAIRDLERFVLFAVLAAMVAAPLTLVHPGGAQVALADVLLLVACFAYSVLVNVGRAPRLLLGGNVLLAPSLAFLTVNALSIGWSGDPRATVKMVVQLTEIVLVFPLLFASVPRSVRMIRTGMLVFVAASVVLAVLAFVAAAPQLAGGHFDAVNLRFGLGNKNAAGSCIAAGFVITYILMLRRRDELMQRVLLAATIVQSLGLIATLSRGSILGAAVAVLLASLMLERRRAFTAGAVVLTLAGYFVFVAPQRAEQKADAPSGAYSSDTVRTYSFDHAIDKIKARPVLGTGSGTYHDYITQLSIELPDPNNMFLLTWAEVGIFGVAALIFLLVRFGRLWWRLRSLPGEAAIIGVAAGGVSISLLVHFQLDVTWTRGTSSLAFAAMGLMLAVARLAPAEAEVVAPRAGGAPVVDDERSRRPGPPRRPGPLGRPAPPRARSVPARPPLRVGGVDARALAVASAPAATARAAPRVLHLVSSDAFAGLERHALRLCEQLRALRLDALLLCPPTAELLRREAGVAEVPTVPSGRSGRGWVRRAVRSARALAPDIVHVHDGRSAALAAVAAPDAALLVRTQHFTRPASVNRGGVSSRLSTGMHQRINRRYAGYIAVSQVAADEAVRRGEVSAERVVVIPPGVELADDDAVVRARAARKAAGEEFRLTFIGRFEAEKRIDVLLHALALARAEVPGLRAVLAGGGRQEEELHALATELGLDDVIEWPGWVTEPDETLGRVHVYVNPWPDEGFGMAMAEAMGFALPVVAPASGASPELVEDGVTGLLVAPRDAEALAAALVRLARDRTLTKRLGAAARERALARYGVEHTAAATAALYADLLRRHAR